MAMPYLARRSVSSLIVPLFVLAGLAAAMPAGAAGAGSHLAGLKPAKAARPGSFTLFESGQVRPLALSPSGKLLFAPVAVAARSDNEIWVVNHLSDSVSVVALSQGGNSGRVVRTLLVGDEPRDIVFGGAGKNRVFITTAQVEQFLLAFDSNLAPIVGQQTTLTQDNGAVVGARIDLLIDRARAGECDLVVKDGGEHGERGYLYDAASGLFLGNRRRDTPVSDASLRQRASQRDGELTYTCTPPGSGVRIGLDRNGNGILDGDEDDDEGGPGERIATIRAGSR